MSRKGSKTLLFQATSNLGRSVVLLAAVLLTAGSALAWNSQFSLAGTTWTGDITVVDTTGATTVNTASTLEFLTESTDFKFVSGTISAPAITFSGIRNGNQLTLGATDYVISAEIVKGFHHHRRGRSSAVLKIQGVNVADGTSFSGALTPQQN